MKKNPFSYYKHAITTIEVSRRTPADGLKPDDAPMSVMFARLNIGPTGKHADAQKARWFDTPTKASLWRVWRIINGEPPFLPPLIAYNYPGTTNDEFEFRPLA